MTQLALFERSDVAARREAAWSRAEIEARDRLGAALARPCYPDGSTYVSPLLMVEVGSRVVAVRTGWILESLGASRVGLNVWRRPAGDGVAPHVVAE